MTCVRGRNSARRGAYPQPLRVYARYKMHCSVRPVSPRSTNFLQRTCVHSMVEERAGALYNDHELLGRVHTCNCGGCVERLAVHKGLVRILHFAELTIH